MNNFENFKPIKNLVLVLKKSLKENLETETGILLSMTPKSVMDRSNTGLVLKQGSDCKNDLINKRVYFDITAGQDLSETLMVLRESDILGYLGE